MKKKKWMIIVIVAILVLTLGIGGIFLWIRKNKETAGNRGNGGFGGKGQMALGAGGVSSYGVTSIGISQIEFEVENLSTGLEIEEVYTSSGEEVEAGTAILKLSEEDVEAAREELEQVLKEADLAYRAGAIEYEQSKITAAYDRDMAVVKGEQAQAVYEETLASLTSDLERAREALAEAQEQIAEYHTYVDDGSYASYFEVDKYQRIYDETLEVLTSKMEEWGVSWPQVTGGRAGGDMSNQDNQYVSVLSSLYKVLEQNLKDLQQAESKYEDALQNASFELQTLELSLPELKQAVLEAEEKYESESLQAKVTYENTLNNAAYAEKNYETAISKAESDYELLKDAYEDAVENLQLFEDSVGDGYFYAQESGSILRVMVRAGQNLTSGSMIFMYSNPDEMTVTVSVDQSDIAEIAVGDTAYVNGTYEGVVKEINPVSSSDSYTSVTYDVTVELSGDLSGLSTNETVTVIFGELPQMNLQEGDALPEGTDGEMPEGFPGGMDGEMPEGFPEGMDGEMPEGFPGGTDGEMPEGFSGGMNGEMPEGFSGGMNGERPQGMSGDGSQKGNRQKGGVENEEAE